MISLTALWLPILVSAIGVFAVSTLVHMVLKYHHHDYDRLPDEDAFMAFLKEQKIGPGNYVFPCALTAEERKDPVVLEKIKNGPAGFVNVMSDFGMGKSLVSWLIMTVVVSIFVAYVASQALAIDTASRAIFRLTSTVAFMAYAGASASESIWKGQRWATTCRHMFDGLLFCLVTGGVFAWLWPAG